MEKKPLLTNWLWRWSFALTGLFLLLAILYTLATLIIVLYG